MPDYVAIALRKENLTSRYHERPPYQQNDYIGWITRGKQAATREKRLQQMLDELHSGTAYMGMNYKAKVNKEK
jgi:uncharacterized protein YdeI (YjbR/CyaY-like superfamily)